MLLLSPQCSCGHGRDHVMVSATGEYTIGGWCLLLIGISAQPVAVKFTCRRCDREVDRTTNRNEIAEIRLWG